MTAYYISIITNILVLLCILLYIPLVRSQSILNKLIYSILVIIFSTLVPVYMGYNILWIMRGSFSDLSITTCLLALLIVIKSLFGFEFKIFSTIFTLVIIFIGLILYSSALGFTSFSLYDIGFNPNIYFLLGFFVVELTLWRYYRIGACIWLLSFIAYYFRLQTSINLWDYLVDPILFIILFLLFLKKMF